MNLFREVLTRHVIFHCLLYSDLHSSIGSCRSAEGDVDVQSGQLSDGRHHRGGAWQPGALSSHWLGYRRLQGTPTFPTFPTSSSSFPLDHKKLIAGVGGE